jgi:hypothetical protein
VVLLRASAVRGTVCFFGPCVVLDVPAEPNSALWLFRARSLSHPCVCQPRRESTGGGRRTCLSKEGSRIAIVVSTISAT